MPRFEFRLQALLALRHNERDGRRAELATAFAAERLIVEGQGALEAEIERQRQWVRGDALRGNVDMEKLRAAANYEAALRTKLEQAVTDRQAAVDEIERCRQALAAAEGEDRALQKLRERQHAEFLRAAALAESRQLDELACRAPGRASRAG